MKLFHEDNSRLRYLTREEYDRLIEAARTIKTSPYLEEKIVLAAHAGLRRGSLFNLRWEQIDLENRVMRIPRTKSGRPLSLPLNATALKTLKALDEAKTPESPYVFPHLAALRRRTARPSVVEDDDPLRAPVAGVPLGGSQPARSSSADASARTKRPGQEEKGKKRAKRSRRSVIVQSAQTDEG